MPGVARFEELKFEILNLALERGEVRFKNVYELARTSYGHISTKTVVKLLDEMVDEDYLEKIVSKVTKRSAYTILPRGAEAYWQRQIIKKLGDQWARISDVMGYEDQGVPTETLIGRYETVMKWLQTLFLCFLPRLKEISIEQDREKALTMMAHFNGKVSTQISVDLGRRLLDREDLNEQVSKTFEAIYSEYEAAKEQFRAHPEIVPKILDVLKEADEAMRRIKDRLKP